jgi:phage repressor protein C with HTH and peptisase S24 domain
MQTSFLALAPQPQQPVADDPIVGVVGRADIPVWASAAAGDGDGSMILTSEPIDYIKRTERTARVKDPFAFHVIGESMLERLAQGDQVIVNTAMPLLPMTDCVFIHQADDGMMYALVKRLLRATGETWRVRQLNPAKDFELSRRKWSKAYRIAEIRPRM